jgi:hypothetical protein
MQSKMIVMKKLEPLWFMSSGYPTGGGLVSYASQYGAAFVVFTTFLLAHAARLAPDHSK